MLGGEHLSWWQHPWARGSLGCGAGGYGVGGSTGAVQGVMGGQGELSTLMCVHVSVFMRVHVSTFMCVHTSACMALPFAQSFGEGGNAALGMLHQDKALGWLLLRGAGSGARSLAGSSSSRHPLHQTCSPTQLVPPSPRPTAREGDLFVSNLLSLLIHCCELYTLKKQPQSLVCTGGGFGSLLWGLQLRTVTVSRGGKFSF